MALSCGVSALGFGVPALAEEEAQPPLQEEFLELVEPSGKRRVLAHTLVDAAPALRGRQRFAVSPDGQFLAYANLPQKSFELLGADGVKRSYAANEGGQALFNPTNPKTLLLNLRQVGRRRVVLVNTETGQHEQWGDFLRTRSVAFTPIGLIVAHDRPAQGGGAITLVRSKDVHQELLRLNAAHTLVSARGNKLGLFAHNEAYALDLDSLKLEPYGVVRFPLRTAAWVGRGLLGVTEKGVYVFRPGRKPLLSLHETDVFTAFESGEHTVVASPRRIYVLSPKRPPRIFRAPHGDFREVRPIAGSEDLLVIRGNAAYRYRLKGDRPDKLLEGRPGVQLRDAALFAGAVVSWSQKLD